MIVWPDEVIIIGTANKDLSNFNVKYLTIDKKSMDFVATDIGEVCQVTDYIMKGELEILKKSKNPEEYLSKWVCK